MFFFMSNSINYDVINLENVNNFWLIDVDISGSFNDGEEFNMEYDSADAAREDFIKLTELIKNNKKGE